MNLDRVKFHACLGCGWRGRKYEFRWVTSRPAPRYEKFCPECHEPVWEETTGITKADDDAGADLRNHLVCHDRDCTNAALWCTEHRSVSGPSVEASPGHVICPVCKGDGTGSPIGADGCGRCGGEGEVPLSQAKGAPPDDVSPELVVARFLAQYEGGSLADARKKYDIPTLLGLLSAPSAEAELEVDAALVCHACKASMNEATMELRCPCGNDSWYRPSTADGDADA